MRLSAQEEYGLRCLMQVALLSRASAASGAPADPVAITEVAAREGLSPEYTAKLLRVLRKGGLLDSVRGANGGYLLARPANEISVFQAIEVLDGNLFDDGFCAVHTGKGAICVHSTACSIRSLWRWIGGALERVLAEITLEDLARGELAMASQLNDVTPAGAGFPHPIRSEDSAS